MLNDAATKKKPKGLALHILMMRKAKPKNEEPTDNDDIPPDKNGTSKEMTGADSDDGPVNREIASQKPGTEPSMPSSEEFMEMRSRLQMLSTRLENASRSPSSSELLEIKSDLDSLLAHMDRHTRKSNAKDLSSRTKSHPDEEQEPEVPPQDEKDQDFLDTL